MPRVLQVPCAGVDGFAGRWIVAVVDGTDVRLQVAATAREVVTLTQRCEAVAVDVPMGLADNGVRSCEGEARARLGSARSSIFSTPPRAVLDHVGDWHGALAAARSAANGKGLSKQSFHILPGIKAFDELRVDESTVVEAHPELSFRALVAAPATEGPCPALDAAGPAVELVSKKTARGQGQRLSALGGWVDIRQALSDVPDGPAMDDVLDALACAWTAHRWAEGRTTTLGGERDGLGKPMRIVI